MKQQTIKIQIQHGVDCTDRDVDAWIAGNLALHYTPESYGFNEHAYTVTHIATGLMLALIPRPANREKILKDMAALSPIFDDMPMPIEPKSKVYRQWFKRNEWVIRDFIERWRYENRRLDSKLNKR